MDGQTLTIGELARKVGCKVQTIRYYEQIGLLPPPDRTDGNQRRYSGQEARRLSFVRHGRDLGFSLDALRQLLMLADHPDQPCETADQIAERHLIDIERRIDRLSALKVELQVMIKQCRGNEIRSCRVIEVLSDHGHCLNDQH
ncbi:MAG: helix-turn-helix domain-containing protein [Alphaproteobacteria bacterium]